MTPTAPDSQRSTMNASPDSPLGAALLGAHPGETVSYEAPAGTFSYTVRAVRPYED